MDENNNNEVAQSATEEFTEPDRKNEVAAKSALKRARPENTKAALGLVGLIAESD